MLESVEMANEVPKKNGLLVKLKKLWDKELFRSIFLLGVTILGVFLFQDILIFALRTDYPLTTPVSTSMEPTLMRGDLLVVQGGLNWSSDIIAGPETGDIIVFRKPGNPEEFLVHRAIEKFQYNDTWYFITKGDNNNNRDYWPGFPNGGVPESYLIGKVIWHIPLLGYIKIYLGTPVGIAISIFLLALLLLLDNIRPSDKSKDSSKGSESSQNTGK